jgi:hypothetical protein
MLKSMSRQTIVDASYWSFQSLKTHPHILTSCGDGNYWSIGPGFEERFQRSNRDLWLVGLTPKQCGSRSMPIFPDHHVVLVHREPKIVLLEYADIEHHVLRWFEAQGLSVLS